MRRDTLALSSTRKKFLIQARQHKIILGKKTKIMGIINVTPDSFSGDGCLRNDFVVEKIVEKAHQLVLDSADMIDVGGESTRPGARRISIQEEIHRVIPVIKKLAKTIKIPISVDTYKTRVAQEALEVGASIVNNILGVNIDKKLLKMIKRYKAAIVLMHIRGTPRIMQKNIHYDNLIGEIIVELQKSVEKCLEIGLKSDKIVIDPGIGFGKTVNHNLEIIQRLTDFHILNAPILIGPSRKSFIGKILKKEVTQRLLGTSATVSAAILKGAHIVRVHDVREMRDIVKMTDAIVNVQNS